MPNLRKTTDESIFDETREMVRDFSELLDAVTESLEDDQQIDPDESDKIRQKWEDLKACAEHFVLSCEQGLYRHKK